MQGADGNIYGSTIDGFGTIFRLSLGLNPFVQPLPGIGKVGNTIKILGQGLTGATSVAFNGTPASFHKALL